MPDGILPEQSRQDQRSEKPVGPRSHPLLGNRPPEARERVAENRLAPPINIRVSIPFLGKRFYFALMAGKERRGHERLAVERRRNPFFTKVNVFFLVAGAAILYALTLGAFIVFATS